MAQEDRSFTESRWPDLVTYVEKYPTIIGRETHFQPIGRVSDVSDKHFQNWPQGHPEHFEPFYGPPAALHGFYGENYAPVVAQPHPTSTIQSNNAHIAVGLGDILGEYGYTGLGEISWNPFTFTTFPAFAKTTAALNSIATVPPMFAKTLEVLTKGPIIPTYTGITTSVDTMMKKFGALLPPQLTPITILELGLTDMATQLKSMVNALKPETLTKISSAYTTLVTNTGVILNNIPTKDDSVLKQGEKVVTIIKKAPDLWSNFHTWAQLFVSTSMDGFKFLRSFADDVNLAFTNLPALVQKKFDMIMGRIQTAAQSIIDQIWGGLKGYSTEVINMITGVVANVTRYVKDIQTAISTYIGDLMHAIERDINYLVGWITSKMRDLVNGIVNDMGAVKDWILSNITGLSTNIRGNIDAFGSQISATVKTQLENFKATIDNVKTQVTTQFNDAVAKAKGELTNYVKDIQTQFQGKIDTLSAEFKAQYTALTDKIKDATSQVTNLMDQTKKVTEMVSALTSKVEAYAPRLDYLEQWVGKQTGLAPAPTGTTEKKGFFASIFS